MSVETILSRLTKVRKTGPDRWMAICPAHADKSPSLSVRETLDGRILIHCFCGCSTEAVLDAIGVEIGELFPESLTHHAPKERMPITSREALAALQPELYTVALIGRQMLDGKHDARTHEALLKAVERISAAHAYVEGL